MEQLRLDPDQRKALIINTGIDLTADYPLVSIDPKLIAKHCKVKTSESTVKFYFRRNADLWRAIAGSEKAPLGVKNEASALGIL